MTRTRMAQKAYSAACALSALTLVACVTRNPARGGTGAPPGGERAAKAPGGTRRAAVDMNRWRLDPRVRHASARQPLRAWFSVARVAASNGQRIPVKLLVMPLADAPRLDVRFVPPEGVTVVAGPQRQTLRDVVAGRVYAVDATIDVGRPRPRPLLAAVDMPLDPVAHFHVQASLPLSDAPTFDAVPVRTDIIGGRSYRIVGALEPHSEGQQ